MKHSNWLVMAIMAVAVIFAAFTVWPQNDAPPTVVETRYVPSDSISKDAFEEQRYRADIAEIKTATLEAQRDWYALIMAVLGILVTVVILIFGFRFGRQAVQEAKLEAEREISGYRKDIEKTQGDARATLEKAKELVADIHRDHKTVKELMPDFNPDKPPENEETRRSIRDIAQEALKKHRKERTADDYRALIITASIDKNWSKMEQRAAAMGYLLADDCNDEELAFAIFNRAYALGELNQFREEIDCYNDLISRFGNSEVLIMQRWIAAALVNKGVAQGNQQPPDIVGAIASYDEVVRLYGESDNPALQEQVAGALFNKGVAQGNQQPPDIVGAIASYDEVVRLYGESDNPALQERVAGALVNKGVAQGNQQPPDIVGAIASYDDVVRRYGESDTPALQVGVAKALFNKACAYALQGTVTKTIEALNAHAERLGHLDCEKIANDSDFDNVRDRPSFQKFLRDHDCQS